MIKTYTELSYLRTFDERYNYLKLSGTIGRETFGFDRYLNQILYSSTAWKHCRRAIIIRDNGCDLGCEGFDIYGRIIVHHIESITIEDVINRASKVFDPDNLISTSHATHNAIHYGDMDARNHMPNERSEDDTCPWKRVHDGTECKGDIYG